MFNGGAIISRALAVALSSASDASPIEPFQSEYADYHDFTVKIASPSSLVGGSIIMQEFDPCTGVWQGCVQEIGVLASAGGTPAALNANTTSATVQVGGVVKNMTGIGTITDAGTFNIRADGNGKKKRLVLDCTSGTAVFDWSYVGKRTFPIG